MASKWLTIGAATFCAARFALAADPSADPQIQLNLAKKNIATLESKRKQLIQQEQMRAKETQAGIDLMARYDALLEARYSDEEGTYQPEKTVTARDLMNLNKLFSRYLGGEALSGIVSAHQARLTLKNSINLLKTREDDQESPSVKNNSEMQILEYQLSQEQSRVEQAVAELEKKPAPGAPARSPASH